MTTATTVKERPILMHARSIKGILEGRKTQTRRIIKGFEVRGPHAPGYMDFYRIGGPGPGWCGAFTPGESSGSSAAIHCPYGQPGDRLWVRETWAQPFAKMHPDSTGSGAGCIYRADDDGIRINPGSMDGRWRSSIHMPRWASRLTLEITDVRVERVQEISAADIEAEGAMPGCGLDMSCDICQLSGTEDCPTNATRCTFAGPWNDTNGKGAWERNDWVWVLSFRAVNL